jgi:hypothetical protein
VPGDSQLANYEHVERDFERPRDLESHRHASTRKRQHDDVVPSGITREQRAEVAPGVGTVAEAAWHRTPLSLHDSPPPSLEISASKDATRARLVGSDLSERLGSSVIAYAELCELQASVHR